MEKEFCRNRIYETKLISHLPHEYRFADGSKSLVVDYATTDQLGQCRKMIDEAALRGGYSLIRKQEKSPIIIGLCNRTSYWFRPPYDTVHLEDIKKCLHRIDIFLTTLTWSLVSCV